MKYQIETRGDVIIFRPMEARLNAAITPELKSQLTILAHSSNSGVIVDLSAVESLDSSVLSALLLLRRMLQPSGRSMVVVAPTPALQSVFNLSKLDEIFTLMTTIEDAMKYMQQQATLLAKKARDEEEEEEWEEEGEDWEEEDWDEDDEDWGEEDEEWEDEDWEEEDWDDEDWDDEDWEEEEEDEEEE
ncbi:MAG: STAS domain-containing protein [Bacteroidia bacterium]|nr:STAS domain-containing protein [Bacteroidia bacterium]